MQPLYKTRSAATQNKMAADGQRYNQLFKPGVSVYSWPKEAKEVQIRILPANWNANDPYGAYLEDSDDLPDSPFFKIHRFMNMGPSQQSFICLQKTLGDYESGPGSSTAQKLFKSLGGEDPAYRNFIEAQNSGNYSKDELFRMGPSTGFACWIRDFSQDRERVMPQIALVSVALYNMILNATKTMQGEDPHPFDDPSENGCDLRIIFTMNAIPGARKAVPVPKEVHRVDPPRNRPGVPAFVASRCTGEENVWDWYYKHPLPHMINFSSSSQIANWLGMDAVVDRSSNVRTEQKTRSDSAESRPSSRKESSKEDDQLIEDKSDPLEDIKPAEVKKKTEDPASKKSRPSPAFMNDEEDDDGVDEMGGSDGLFDDDPPPTKTVKKEPAPKKAEAKPVTAKPSKSSKAWDDD